MTQDDHLKGLQTYFQETPHSKRSMSGSQRYLFNLYLSNIDIDIVCIFIKNTMISVCYILYLYCIKYTSNFCRETTDQSYQFLDRKQWIFSSFQSDKCLKGTVVNMTSPSKMESHLINIQSPLKGVFSKNERGYRLNPNQI